MKKLVILLSLLLLTACAPDEARFKSTVEPTPRDDIALAADTEEPVEGDPELDSGGNTEPGPELDSGNSGEDSIDEDSNSPTTAPPPELPSQINLDVTFYPQAPDADWGMPWQEACEEASLILAYYYAMDKPLTKEKFKEEVWGLVNWQKENYNDYIHTNTDQNAEMLKEYFGYENFEIVDNPTAEDMKKALAAGHPIVAPFAGRMMENPFFTPPGPYYHVIVIKGYDGKNFITNDVGTRRGHNFIYSYENIMSSLHDYDEEKDITEGEKNMIVMKAVVD